MAVRTLRLEAEAIENLCNRIDNDFVKTIELIYRSEGRVVVTGTLIAGSVFASFAALLSLDLLRVAHLAMGSLVLGATFAFMGPARQALVVDLVPQRHRGNAMALAWAIV